MATARSRSETQKDGRQAMVAYAEWIPYKSIGTSPPDVTPTWSIIDFTDNWEIEYVEIPDGKFTANTIEFLRTLPELRIVEVKRSGKGYYLPTEAESSQIRMVRKSLPKIDVIYMYDHY